MIHLFGDYYIKGNPVYTVLGYYGSVANACEGLRKMLSRELTAEKDMELYEAVTAFKQIAERLEKATEGLK